MDQNAYLFGQALGSLWSDAAAHADNQRVQAIIDGLARERDRFVRERDVASRQGCRAAGLKGAFQEALRQVDPRHPLFTDEEMYERIQDLAVQRPPNNYASWAHEAQAVGEEIAKNIQRDPSRPAPRVEIAQLRDELQRLRAEHEKVCAALAKVSALEKEREAIAIRRTHKMTALQVGARRSAEEASKALEKEKLETFKASHLVNLSSNSYTSRLFIDLVHHRAQRAVFRSELARLAPDHPLVTDSRLRESISKAAEMNVRWAGFEFEVKDGQRIENYISLNPKDLPEELWKRLDGVALEEFSQRCGNYMLKTQIRPANDPVESAAPEDPSFAQASQASARADEQVSQVSQASPFAALVSAEDPLQPQAPGQGDDPVAVGPAAAEP
jgi:hypothetical protein